MKKILVLLFTVISLSVFGQSYNPVTQRQDFQNDVKFTKTSPVVPYADAVNKAVPLGQLNSLLGFYLFKTDTTHLSNRINAKENIINAGTIYQYWRGDKSWQTLNSTSVGLGNVTNNAQWYSGNHPTTTTDYGLPAYPDISVKKDKNDSIIKPSAFTTLWRTQHMIDSLSALKANVSDSINHCQKYITSDSQNNLSIPFNLKSTTTIYYNGVPLQNQQWSGIGSTTLNLILNTKQNDYLLLIN